jgi:asparagine synthase (glutamine-hydrolysing)
MFAFAVVDYERQRLFLARDHFGIKPLYYRVGSDFLAFASEISTLQVIEAPASDGDLFAVDLFLRFQYIPAPYTIYRDVHKLLPAHTLICRFDGKKEEPRRFWQPRFEPDSSMTENDAVDQLHQVLNESVRAHLVADVPFGVFLSGGIDSTLVALCMAKYVSPLKAFTIGFEEEAFNEIPYAQEAARHSGIDLRVEVVRESSLACLPELMRHYGEPFGDDSAVPTSYLCRFARRQVPMVLSGDGGDEMFGGYGSYLGWMDIGEREAHRMLLKRLRHTFQKWLGGGLRYRASDWLQQILYFTESERQALWRPAFQHFITRDCALFQRAHEEAQRFERLAYAQFLDLNTYLPGAILPKVDVASMAHGLEVRVPFLDLRVFEFAARIPQHLCLGLSPSGTKIGKMVPKKLLQRQLSEAFVYRRKQGFTAPQKLWFCKGNPARSHIEEALFASSSALSEWFLPSAIRTLLQQQDSGIDVSKRLWLLWVLAIWRQQNPHVNFRGP